MTNDYVSQLPSNAQNGTKLHTAPKAIFIFLCRFSTRADDPRRRYTSDTFHNDAIQTGSLPRVPLSDTVQGNAL